MIPVPATISEPTTSWVASVKSEIVEANWVPEWFARLRSPAEFAVNIESMVPSL